MAGRSTQVCWDGFFPRSLVQKTWKHDPWRTLPDNVSVWDCKPERKEDPINWVELKTTAEIYNERDMIKYERKLLKFWAQSFLLGVPKIIVGFRNQQGILLRIEELETHSIPVNVKKHGRGSWDGNVCINFAAAFLECRQLYK